jgi:hypothetical protein
MLGASYDRYFRQNHPTLVAARAKWSTPAVTGSASNHRGRKLPPLTGVSRNHYTSGKGHSIFARGLIEQREGPHEFWRR